LEDFTHIDIALLQFPLHTLAFLQDSGYNCNTITGEKMKDVQYIINKNKEAVITPDGIAVIDHNLEIIVFNEAASRISGFAADDIVGKKYSELFNNSPDDVNYISGALNENRVYTNLSINITMQGGLKKNIMASIIPITEGDAVLSVVFVFRDTREMFQLSEELENKTMELVNQKNRLDAIFNSNIEGTFTIDSNWIITSFNTSAENITGYKKAEAIGKKCRDIFNSTLCGNGCHMEDTMRKAKPMIGNELEIVHKSGRKVPIRVNSGILLDNNNKNIGAVETFIDLSEIKNLSSHLNDIYKYENIVGRNKEIKQIITVLESVSQTDSSVLITGESGTGKELAARAIHINSQRKTGPFVAVNCSAFAESLIESELFGHEKGAFTGADKTRIGRFELAHDGTIFLDEIGDLSPSVQTKLLRVLETKDFERVGGNKTLKMTARIIAATNKNLIDEISAGRFREDLFYRINVINVHLPPLRERMDDFPLLVNHFINSYNQKFNKSIRQFSAESFEILLNYKYPGNIRELENIIEHCFVLCNGSIIHTNCLPKRIREYKEVTTINSFSTAEKDIIIAALDRNNWNKSKTASELSINPSTLWRKMKKLGIISPGNNH